MLFHKNPQDHTGAIDLYPHTDDATRIIFQDRLTVMYKKIYLNGNEWTVEHMQREKKRVKRLEAAFKVAQAIIESDEACPQCHLRRADVKTRRDCQGRHWCQECQDEFDSVDWYALARESENANI